MSRDIPFQAPEFFYGMDFSRDQIEKIKSDIQELLDFYSDFQASRCQWHSVPTVLLRGKVQVIRNTEYDIPLALLFPKTYPRDPPACKIPITQDLRKLIVSESNVDDHGYVTLKQRWNGSEVNPLGQLIQNLSLQFSEKPPMTHEGAATLLRHLSQHLESSKPTSSHSSHPRSPPPPQPQPQPQYWQGQPQYPGYPYGSGPQPPYQAWGQPQYRPPQQNPQVCPPGYPQNPQVCPPGYQQNPQVCPPRYQPPPQPHPQVQPQRPPSSGDRRHEVMATAERLVAKGNQTLQSERDALVQLEMVMDYAEILEEMKKKVDSDMKVEAGGGNKMDVELPAAQEEEIKRKAAQMAFEENEMAVKEAFHDGTLSIDHLLAVLRPMSRQHFVTTIAPRLV